jgi:hypothetical protein
MAALALAAATMTGSPAVAAEAETVDCIQLQSIDRTEVVDDQTILFHLRNRTVLQNKLPFRCFGLKFDDGFAYKTSTNQLCGNLDIIHPVRSGGSCGLGPFERVTPAPKG